MRRRQSIQIPYAILAVILFFWMNLPPPVADRLRYFSVASLSPAWGWARGVQKYLSDRPTKLWSEKRESDEGKIAQLELENTMLRQSVEKMSQWISSEERIKEQFELSKKWEKGALPPREFFERRASHLLSLIQSELMAMPAQVIYRDPSSWSSSLWINVGEEDNRILGHSIIAKNSPVVFGSALLGVVDYVGKKQSRVRLITDSGLSPAVRSVRGGTQRREVSSLVASLIHRLELRSGKEGLLKELKSLHEELEAKADEHYLAKGEIHGSGSPLWRSRSMELKGVGFNFDHADVEGSAPKGISLLEKGDLLVTTGFDGVFPPDLQVGIVTEVTPPKPGGYAYSILVRPVADHLDDLETLFVLPPRGD